MLSEYVFNINFPMSVVCKDDITLVSYGYGDYYTMVAEFDTNSVLGTITHDVSAGKKF